MSGTNARFTSGVFEHGYDVGHKTYTAIVLKSISFAVTRKVAVVSLSRPNHCYPTALLNHGNKNTEIVVHYPTSVCFE